MSTNPHDVREGDEYLDLEFAHRHNGNERRFRVTQVHEADGLCVALSTNTNRTVSIRLDRFKPSKSGIRGYRLASRRGDELVDSKAEEARQEV